MKQPKHILAISLLLFLTTLSVAQHDANIEQSNVLPYNNLRSDPRFDPRISNLLSQKVLQFAQDVGRVVLKESQAKTEVFSPLSIWGALSLVLLGASGQTHQEFMNLLNFNTDSYLNANPWKIHEEFGLLIEDIASVFTNSRHPRPRPNWKLNHTNVDGNEAIGRDSDGMYQRISIANGIFTQNGYTVRPDYRDAVLGVYRSTIDNLDFANDGVKAAVHINKWVSDKTLGKITSIVPNEMNPQTKLIIASALYFNAVWEKTFIDGATGPRKFYPNGLENPHIMVDMMAHGGLFPFYDAKEYDCRILALPYKNNLTTMYIIQPNNSNRQRLNELQASLTAEIIDYMISKMEYKTTVLLFPKMHLASQLNLKKVFLQMGFSTLFDLSRSDLSLISSGEERHDSFSGVNNRDVPNTAINFPNGHISVSPNIDLPNAAQAPRPNNNPQDIRPIYMRFPNNEEDSNEPQFLFSRLGESETAENQTSTNTTMSEPKTNTTSPLKRNKRNVNSFKADRSFRSDDDPPRLKDYILNKRLSKSYPNKKYRLRTKRQVASFRDASSSLKNLDQLRNSASVNHLQNPGLFVEEIIHKVDLKINEKGTEGGAATVTYLSRTGTDVVFRVETPFLFFVRHEDTKLPLFYGAVYEPTDF